MTRVELLDQAKSIVTGERQQAYGSIEDNFGRIAAYWSAHLGITVTTHDVAVLMTLLKLARLHNTPGHEDSWVDVAGYAACAVELPLVRDRIKGMCFDCDSEHTHCCDYTENSWCPERKEDGSCWRPRK